MAKKEKLGTAKCEDAIDLVPNPTYTGST